MKHKERYGKGTYRMKRKERYGKKRKETYSKKRKETYSKKRKGTYSKKRCNDRQQIFCIIMLGHTLLERHLQWLHLWVTANSY